MGAKFATVDEYAATLNEPATTVLSTLRNLVTDLFPQASESIRYQMPCFSIPGGSGAGGSGAGEAGLLHAGLWKHHLGIYPIPPTDPETAAQLVPHHTSKGTLQFRYDQPIPWDLIRLVLLAAGNRALSNKTES